MLLHEGFKKRKARVRFNLKKKCGGKLRLTVFRSAKHLYAQIINDDESITLVSSSTLNKELASKLKLNKSNIEAAKLIGQDIAKKAANNNITEVVFDRGGYIYHGVVKALADAARENGLKF